MAKNINIKSSPSNHRSSDALLNDPHQKLPVDMREHIIDYFLLFSIKTLNYLFMLIAMTFNFGCILTILFGLSMSNFFWEYKNDLKYIDKALQKQSNNGNFEK